MNHSTIEYGSIQRKEAFLAGELIYHINQKIYVKDKYLSKWGFMQKAEGDGKVFRLTTPLKLYRKDYYRIGQKGYYRNKVLKKINFIKKKNKEVR